MGEGLLGYILREWRVIKNAPIAFCVTVALAAVLIWLAMEWRYGAQIENKDTENASLAAENSSLAAQNIVQSERLGQKDDYIKELESKSAAADVRDDQSLYQGGLSIASVKNPQIDVQNQTLIFPIVTSSRELDMARGFEFRDWTMVCGGASAASIVTIGAERKISYRNVKCRITGNR